MATMGRRPTVNLNLPARMRARKRGETTYYYYDAGGKPRKEIALGTNYADAVRKWVELEGDKAKMIGKMITFKDLADEYLKKVIPEKAARTQSDNIKELAWLLKFFNDPPAPLDEIRPVHVQQYLDWRKAGGGGLTRANRERALLSHMYNKARQWGYTDKENPCRGVEGFEEKGRGDVYIEDDIYRAVYNMADQPLRDALDLAYLTGQRPADVRKMSQAHITDGALEVQQNKTTKKLRIKVEGELDALLVRIAERKKKYPVHSLALIVNERGQALSEYALRSRFDKARDKAKRSNVKLAEAISNYQFRDLRAKAGTDTADDKGTREAQRLLGHETIAMTEHYVRQRRGDVVSPTR